MSRTVRTVLVYLLVVTVAIMLVNAFVSSATAPEEFTLDEFTNRVAAGEVESVVIKQKSNVVEGVLTPAAGGSSIKLNEWSREATFAADLARWADEQRAIIRELADTGRDVSTADELLKSITHLYAGKVAARILKRVSRGTAARDGAGAT